MLWRQLTAEDLPVSVRYRALRDLAGLRPDHPELAAVREQVMAYPPAVQVAQAQDRDGTWRGRLHTGDSRAGHRLTMEIQFPRLIEYGWDMSQPAVGRAVRRLLSLLRHCGDPAMQLSDISTYMRGPGRIQYFAQFSRFICAGLLAGAGLDEDPLVRSACVDYVRAAYRFVTGPAATRPFRGEKAVVVEEAFDEQLCYPAIPDLYFLQLIAFSPGVRRELASEVSTVLDYVLGDEYQAFEDRLGMITGDPGPFVKGWKIDLVPAPVLAESGRLAYGLILMELLARVGRGSHPRVQAMRNWIRTHETDDGMCDLPTRALSRRAAAAFGERIQLAPNWRRPRWRVADVTFRVRLFDSLTTERLVQQ